VTLFLRIIGGLSIAVGVLFWLVWFIALTAGRVRNSQFAGLDLAFMLGGFSVGLGPVLFGVLLCAFAQAVEYLKIIADYSLSLQNRSQPVQRQPGVIYPQ
jgi:hypothetical protein